MKPSKLPKHPRRHVLIERPNNSNSYEYQYSPERGRFLGGAEAEKSKNHYKILPSSLAEFIYTKALIIVRRYGSLEKKRKKGWESLTNLS